MHYRPMVRRWFFAVAVVLIGGIAALGAWQPGALWAFAVVGPLVLLGFRDALQGKHSLLRNYPVIGHGRYLLEEIRPEIQQYFVETNTNGKPFSRNDRSVVYRRAKKALQSVPFGTQEDLYEVGAEWVNHSVVPRHAGNEEPRVSIGGSECTQPYAASHLNISAMSYGSLSKNAIEALSRGARAAGCFHNTGEGGVSPYHLAGGADLCWQIGTGYFGCRAGDGGFDRGRFAEQAARPEIKLVEVKLSQGAKPAHGGILPGDKVTPEIAAIRGVPVGETVHSPPGHRTFSTPRGLLEFVADLREASGGKPVGFKLCVGHRRQFMAICKAMVETGLRPDFIAIDGAEGGTGAAPLEFSDSVGMPLDEGLLFARNALVGCNLKDDIRLIASGKVTTGYRIIRSLALGADLCTSARAMMFALGCIQARRCNSNDCPVGVATTNAALVKGLVVEPKARRVENYHRATIRAFMDLVGAAGVDNPGEIEPHHVSRRTAHNEVRHFDEIYAYVEPGAIVGGEAPDGYQSFYERASADAF